MRILRPFTIRLLAGWLVLASVAMAQNETPTPARPLADLLSDWKGGLDQAVKQVADPRLGVAELDKVRAEVDKVRAATAQARADAQAKVTQAKELLDALGPAPAEGQPPEAKEVTAQRKQLQADYAGAEGRLKQLEVTEARTQALLADISKAVRERLANNLLAQGPELLNHGVWGLAGEQIGGGLVRMVQEPIRHWQEPDFGQRLRDSAGLLGLLVLGLAGGWWLRGWLLRRYGRDPAIAEPSYARRTAAALVEALCRTLMPVLATVAIAATLRTTGLVADADLQVLHALTMALVFFILVVGVDRAAFAPAQPAWRIAPLAPKASRRLSRRLNLLAAIVAPMMVLSLSANALAIGDEGVAVITLIGSTALGLGLLTLTRRRLWKWRDDGDGAKREDKAEGQDEHTARPLMAPVWALLRLAVVLIAVASPVLAVFGYQNLARYLLGNLVWSGIGLGVLLLARMLVDELVGRSLRIDGTDIGYLARAMALRQATAQQLAFWLMLLVDTLLFGVAAALLLLRWGVSWADLSAWLEKALFGFKVGGVMLSLMDLLLAVLLFSVVLAATRMTQRVLDERVLPHTRMDIGLRNSCRSGVGYVGMVIALVVAVSTLGLDLSKVALLAGALSVGIGFGLQNIVSNFVSGLILLAERPIKVGDWVVVGGSEGIVRRINVRATELETFQRASVLIPNSNLLSQAVVNLTHKDTFGRVEVPVGVAYESDPEQVKRVLLEVAQAHPDISRWPQPFVVFKAFGPSSMDFELRAFLANVELKGGVASDLRFAIVKAFREAGIEIPFNQAEVRLRDLDRLETLVAELRSRLEAQPEAITAALKAPARAGA